MDVSRPETAVADAPETASGGRTRSRIGRMFPAFALVTGMAIFPLVAPNAFVLQFGVMVLFFAYYGTAWNIIGGYARQLSLAHPVFLAIGAYSSTILFLQTGLTPWIGMLVGAALAVAAAMLLGAPSFRLRGPYFALATLGFLEIARLMILENEYVGPIRLGQAAGLSVPYLGDAPQYFQFAAREVYYFIAAAALLGALLLSRAVRDSRLGYYLKAIRDDQDAAESLGVNPARMKLVALAISAAMTSVAGTFYAQFFLYMDPYGLMSLDMAFQPVLLTIVGGAGTVAGPVLGALLLRPLTDLSNVFLGGTPLAGLHLVVLGLILIIVVLYIPKGIQGPAARLWDRLTSRATSGGTEA